MQDADEKLDRTLMIDDVRDRAAVHILARTYSDGLNALCKLGPWHTLLLDHDLGSVERQYTEEGRELTGYDIVVHLEQFPELRPQMVGLVTDNPVGLKRMRAALERMYRDVSHGGRWYSDPVK